MMCVIAILQEPIIQNVSYVSSCKSKESNPYSYKFLSTTNLYYIEDQVMHI